MARARSIGRWIGGLSSAGVVGGGYAAVGLLALFDEQLAEAGALVALALVLTHVLLRPTRRADVGNTAGIPGWTAMSLHGIFGWPEWAVVAPLAVVIVAVLAYEDREERRAARA